MGAILSLAGGATSGFGGLMATKAKVESIRYNRKLQNFQAELAAEDTLEAGRKVASKNVVAIAKSGVRREGSPLEVLANNAYDEARTASLVAAGVQIRSDLLTRGADQAQIAGVVSAAASVLGASGQAASSINFGSSKTEQSGGGSTTTFSAGSSSRISPNQVNRSLR
jgi:hypothetical protein